MQRLKRRQDFLAAAKARSQAMPGLVLQVRDRKDGLPPRIGFTTTKKLGNAVIRNRTKRRLREAARLGLGGFALCGFDYVLIGRAATAARPFAALRQDLIAAVGRLHPAPPSSAHHTERP